MEPKSPLADSPWFWALSFSGMALAALVAMGPKYGQRQARIELQYQARDRVAEQQTAGDTEVALDERREFATPEDTLIPLWPLAAVLGLVMLFAAVMLFRGRRNEPSQSEASVPR